MRLDYLTIFPDYLAPLVALAARQGRAPAACSTCTCTTCASWTHDRHHTVDDTPYGGGAGMVMKPEPWGEALDDARRVARPARPLVVPTPSGRAVHPGTGPRARRPRAAGLRLRALRGHRPAGARPRRDPGRGARDLASATTCSTAERSPRWRSPRPSCGCCRASWATPRRWSRSRTRTGCWSTPSTPSRPRWRGLDVPDGAALGGDHGAIAAWRHDAGRAPYGGSGVPTCCAASTRAPTAGRSCRPRPADAGEMLTLQRACWVAGGDRQRQRAGIPALHEYLDDVRPGWGRGHLRRARRRPAGGPVRGRLDGDGVGHRAADGGPRPPGPRPRPGAAGARRRRSRRPRRRRTGCSPGKHSVDNLRMYKKAGFRVREVLEGRSGPVVLVKPARRDCDGAGTAVADSSWPSRPKGRPDAHLARDPRRASCHRGSSRRRPHGWTRPTLDHHPIPAADLWHSRGAS